MSDLDHFTLVYIVQEAKTVAALQAARALTASLNEVKAAACDANRPLSDTTFNLLRAQADEVLAAFDCNPLAAGEFRAVLRYTVPALLDRIADLAFSMANSRPFTKAKTAFLDLLDDLPQSGAQDHVAKQLSKHVSAFVDDCSEKLTVKADRDWQQQLLRQQFKPAEAQRVPLQGSAGHNRSGKGICFSWDGKICHGAPGCQYEHPDGKPSRVYLSKSGSQGRPYRRY